MPTYDYVCDACGHALEIFHSISEAPKKKCPKCGKQKLARKIGAGAGILFKGGGFYQTDYRSDSYKAAAKADSGESAPATPAAADATKTDTPATPKSEETPAKTAKSESKTAAESKPKKSKKD